MPKDDNREAKMYGANAAEWLRRWDTGEIVWSISMGGLGPGYEQAIQITTAEILRHLLESNYDASKWDNPECWREDREKIWQAGLKSPIIDDLGLSGAQWGVALNLASNIYCRGPVAVMRDKEVAHRHIQVSKNFPGKEAPGK